MRVNTVDINACVGPILPFSEELESVRFIYCGTCGTSSHKKKLTFIFWALKTIKEILTSDNVIIETELRVHCFAARPRCPRCVDTTGQLLHSVDDVVHGDLRLGAWVGHSSHDVAAPGRLFTVSLNAQKYTLGGGVVMG